MQRHSALASLVVIALAAPALASCSDTVAPGAPEDTGSLPLEVGSDTGLTTTDSSSPADSSAETATPTDTAVATDTTVATDAPATDTAVADTAVAADTAVGTDTTVAADTTVAPDTAASDTGTPTDTSVVTDTSTGLGGLSDEFGGTALDASWLLVNPGLLKSYGVSSGALQMEPKNGALWYHASTGSAIYKSVTGDFKVTTTAHVRKATDASATPNANYQLAGLIARNPASDGATAQENYVFVVVGYRADTGGLVLETKNTVSDVSTDPHPSWPSGDAELRICRRGTSYRLYKRTVGATTWTLAITLSRTDLPATLQVGVITYAQATADIRGTFDRVVFANVASDADCIADP